MIICISGTERNKNTRRASSKGVQGEQPGSHLMDDLKAKDASVAVVNMHRLEEAKVKLIEILGDSYRIYEGGTTSPSYVSKTNSALGCL